MSDAKTIVRILLLSAFSVLACGEPADAGDLTTAMLCGGYVESSSGTHMSDFPDDCSTVVVAGPPGSVLTREFTGACGVANEGSVCLVLAPGEQFRAWSRVQYSGQRVEWFSFGSCEEGCPQ